MGDKMLDQGIFVDIALSGEQQACLAPPSTPENMTIQLLHVTDHYSASSGGVASVIDQLSAHMAAYYQNQEVVCVRGNPLPATPGVKVTNIDPIPLAKAWGWSPRLVRTLSAFAQEPDGLVLHIHGVWMAPQWLAARIASKRRIPFVLSTHGMLEPWFWKGQGAFKWLKKNVYWRLGPSGLFARAAVVHAVTEREMNNLRDIFPNTRIQTIPNAIDLTEVDEQQTARVENPEPLILFLGRLTPQKGLELLLEGFAEAHLEAPWRIVIAGPFWFPAYASKLRVLARDLGIESRVEFIGPVFGIEKWTWLKRAWMVVTPSWAEGVSVVNLEAAACYTPLITTRETGLPDWEEGGGILIQRDKASMASALKAACRWPLAERLKRGEASRALVDRRYSWKAVLPMWLSLYRSISS
jgi:glycosyltransferase involved in cell wall biosynthesis